ncbi:NADP-dependent oxidoreductase [Weissella halotolerans]|uniref:NADPH quinone reductase n=1 Tax=Weissella halotolerans DSM 20190 TaxID=1123500 RepID=A0A0R2FUU9_9LACO|nr:NADP-dependent oxidoreductase [Weissella halotolerans]KRN32201.1 NADPH quinone reductase [Weissella halotolerans DSM 20190]
MQAIQLRSFGPVSQLNTATVNRPTIKPKQVLIETHAVAIEPYDVKFVAGQMPYQKSLPVIPGSSVMGTITAIGSEVTDFKIGDRVAANRYLQTYAEYVAVPASALALVPPELNDSQAVAVAVSGATGYQLIHDDLDLKAQQKILIQGGAGAVGTIAIQEAKLLGAHVYATANPRDFSLIEKLGATPIDYHQDYAQHLSNFDAVLDPIGGKTAIQSARLLKKGGKLRNLTSYDEATIATFPIDAAQTWLKPKGGPLLEKLYQDIVKENFMIRIDTIAPFNEQTVRQMHTALREDSSHGKLVLTF